MRMHFVQKANRISTYEIDVDMVLSRNSVLKCFLFQNELYLVTDWLTYAQCSPSHFEKNPKVSVQGAQLRDLFSMHLWT